ncbi:secretin N-terminal domain-containing protein [Desulfonatronum lacustre]|uniref:secretin N-terminal domain-containing protein n=1 Tax=Desulfonatronum lacustre TaxID=66849 RepID=UPI0004B111EC|nr:secretin N-terminal domain-containing protein [Desulfonatronum lacustre]
MTHTDRTQANILAFFPGFLAALLTLVLLWGCASTSKEDPMDHWRELSEQALAHTPTDRPLEPRFEIPEASLILDPEPETSPDTPFPQQRVSLRMQEAPMATLLMALARAAQVNMVLSPSVRAMQGVSVIIDDVPWETAFRNMADAHGLVYVWNGAILQVRTVDDVKQDMERERVAQDFTKLRAEAMHSGPLVTSVIKLRYLNIGQDPSAGTDGRTGTSETSRTSGNDLTGMITKLLGSNGGEGAQGVVVPHPETNSLVLQAPRNVTNKVFALLEHLDRPRPQILIQAHIVETTKDTARDLGFQWGGRRAGFAGDQPWMVAPGVGGPAGGWPAGELPPPFFDQGQGSGGMAGNFPADLTSTLTGLTLGFITGSPNYLEVQLSALQQDGKLNILSSPSITTMNNLMAFTENGEKVPYVSRDKDGNREVKFEDAVLRLEITPHVVDTEHLRLDIRVKKDEVDLTRQVEGNPFIIKKETQTSLVVGNEETVVISGLTKELTSRRLDGVPWLKDLPGLGALFRRDASRLDMEEVLIFITPTIIPQRSIPLSQNTAPRPFFQ